MVFHVRPFGGGKYGSPQHSQVLQESPVVSPVLGEPKCLRSSQREPTSRKKDYNLLKEATTMCLNLEKFAG